MIDVCKGEVHVPKKAIFNEPATPLLLLQSDHPAKSTLSHIILIPHFQLQTTYLWINTLLPKQSVPGYSGTCIVLKTSWIWTLQLKKSITVLFENLSWVWKFEILWLTGKVIWWFTLPRSHGTIIILFPKNVQDKNTYCT